MEVSVGRYVQVVNFLNKEIGNEANYGLGAVVALAGSLYAAEPPQDASGTKKKATKKPAAPSVSTQLGELKEAIEAQQQQILQMNQALQSRDQKIQQLEQRLDQSQAVATQAQAKADAALLKPLTRDKPSPLSRAT